MLTILEKETLEMVKAACRQYLKKRDFPKYVKVIYVPYIPDREQTTSFEDRCNKAIEEVVRGKSLESVQTTPFKDMLMFTITYRNTPNE